MSNKGLGAQMTGSQRTTSGDSPMRRAPWVPPRLVPIGTVAEMTSKVDNVGRNDGGSGQKKRT